MKYIKLTNLAGNEMWINFARVRYFSRNSSGSLLSFTDGKATVGVKETPEEIVEQLK